MTIIQEMLPSMFTESAVLSLHAALMPSLQKPHEGLVFFACSQHQPHTKAYVRLRPQTPPEQLVQPGQQQLPKLTEL